MAGDHNDNGETGMPPTSPNDDGLALVYEIIEALTAIGNYVATANDIRAREWRRMPTTLREALEKSLEQCERANEAARRLRDLLRRDSLTDDSGP